MRSAHPAPSCARRARLGARAEDVVAEDLLRQGYQLVARNLRVGHLEIDLIARFGDLLVFVEVRHRGIGAWQGPFESVTPAKRARIRKAASLLWHQRFAADASVNRMRFDVAAVSFDMHGSAQIEYAVAAF